MNIAFFSECYHPTRNGVVVSIDTFSRHLQELGHSVHVYAPSFHGFREEPSGISRFPSLQVRLWPDYPLGLPFTLRTRAQFAARNFDIVHTHSVFTMSHAGSFLAKRFDVPLVCTFHTMLLEYLHYALLPPALTRPIVTRIIRRYCNRCDLLIVPTSRIGSFLREVGVHTEIQPLATGIDLQLVRGGEGETVRAQLGIPPSHKVLLYVGRIAREKNMEFLMEAAGEILQAEPETHFLLVGGGPLIEECRSLAIRTGLDSRIHLIGSVPREAVRHYYAASEVFVFASTTETQGLVIGEAMAAGLPVVAVRGLGVTDFIHTGKDGFLVDESKTAFVQTVRQLLSNEPLRKAMSTAAQEKSTQFSALASSRRLEGFYQSLLSSTTSSRKKTR